jgi:Mg2+-importing ATPase
MIRHDFKFWSSWGNGRSRERVAPWQLGPDRTSKDTPEDILRWVASMDTDLAFAQLLSSNDGISDAEATARRGIHGENVVSSSKPQSWFMLLLSVLPNPFNILLVFLAILNVALPDPSWVSTIYIFV